MRFELSRLAQAIIVAALCSSPAIAADTGIQASENGIQQQPSVAPVSSSVIQQAPGERVARPYIPERIDNSVITADNKIYGPVTKTDTSWSIANKIRKLYPGQGITTRQIMRILYRKNRGAYAGGQLDSLLAGSYLTLPSLDEIKTGISVSSKQSTKPQVRNAKPAGAALTTNEVATSSAPATILPAPAQTTITAVSSAEQPLVDSKVSELVNGTVSEARATTPVSAAESTTRPQTEDGLKYQTENKELKEQIDRLNTEISTLRSSVQEQEKAQKELQKRLNEQEQSIRLVQEKKTESAPQASATAGSGLWHDVLALPLHVQFLMSLPVLAFLVVLSIWLRNRTKHEPVVRNQEEVVSETQVMPDVATIPVTDHPEELNIANIVPVVEKVEVDKTEPLFTAIDEHIPVNETTETPVPVLAFTAEPEPEPEPELETELEPEARDFIPAPEVNVVADVVPATEIVTEAEVNDAVLASRLNLNKIMAEPGLQMSDQVVSEPEGWELSIDDGNPTVLTATIAPGVNLKEVHNDSGRSWLQQFEPEPLKDRSSEEYLTIEELLSRAEQQELGASVNPDMMQPNLDVGLDSFPDMLPKHDGIDIDDDGGVGAKLDLARAYLEIDDKASAKTLLLEVKAAGSDEQIKEAERLLSRMV